MTHQLLTRWKRGSVAKYRVTLVAVFCVALALRIGAASAFVGLGSPPSFSAAPDQLDYEGLAYNLSVGAGYVIAAGTPTAQRAPGTSFALLPVYELVGRSFVWGRIWFCLLSALTCVATAWVAKQCFGPVTAIIAAAWLACYPGHFYYAMHFVSEVPYGLWLVMACGFSLRALASTGKGATLFDAAAGLLWGLAVLTRPQMLFILPVVAATLIVSRRGVSGSTWSHAIAQVIVMGLVILPWVVRNEIVVGKANVSTLGGETFWGAHNEVVLRDPALRGSWVRPTDLSDARHPLPSGNEVEREAAAWKYGLDFVGHHWRSMPGLVGMKMVRLLSPFETTPNRPVFWSFAVSWLVTAPWVGAGIWLSVKARSRPGLVLLAPVAATLAVTLVFYGSIRFRDSMIPILVVFASHAVVATASRFGINGAGPLTLTPAIVTNQTT
jgi:4-amino-4-deoxy-L-arabinose transferase-like glycosyltransferase